MRYRRFSPTDTPGIYADLLLEFPDGQIFKVDVEQPGWLAQVQPLFSHARRVGLVMRGEDYARLWLSVNGTEPAYLSRVIGKIDESGHRRQRVAGLICGDRRAWLHRDGLVEVGMEPTWRE